MMLFDELIQMMFDVRSDNMLGYVTSYQKSLVSDPSSCDF